MVGGENNSTTLTAALHPTAIADYLLEVLVETQIWYSFVGGENSSTPFLVVSSISPKRQLQWIFDIFDMSEKFILLEFYLPLS